MNPTAQHSDDSLPSPATQPAGPVDLSNLQVPPTPMPSQGTSTPTVADDADLIEKEWVHKAKEIVSQTKDNPNQQSAAINRFKADYMKKRYNKDLKVTES